MTTSRRRTPTAPQTTTCTYATEGADQMSFALDLLEARGELEPDSPQTEAFVQAYIKDTITHEVGHTLGLRHNFKASTSVTRDAAARPGLREHARHLRLGDGLQRLQPGRWPASPRARPT